MARKSRKNPLAPVESSCPVVEWSTALYVRMSVEDRKKRGDSIQNQQDIMQNYLALRPEFVVYDTYIDNGTTGMNFDRPNFKRMMADVEAGKVNCIMVKDLSRLGRNAVDTGYYIEQYFPLHHVRFIAVTDDYDSEDNDNRGSSVIVPLKNLLNEAYAADISRKMRASSLQNMKEGAYIGARPPYGYRKDLKNCHKLIVDSNTAPIVRQMFQWTCDGVGLNSIVIRLNEAGIISPGHYGVKEGYYAKPIGSGKWHTRTVAKILSDAVYTGDMIQGKTRNVNHRQIPVKEEDWIVVRNTHEAIVTHEQFEAVQRIRTQIAHQFIQKEITPYTANIFKGKIFCGYCGKALHRQRTEERYYFFCLSNSRVAKGACKGIYILETELCDTVLALLREQAEIIMGRKLKLQKNKPLLESKQSGLKLEISSLQLDVDKSKRYLQSLYENLVNHNLTSEDYRFMQADYTAKIENSLSRIEQLKKELEEIKEQSLHLCELAEDMENVNHWAELTAVLVERLVERIVIHPDKVLDIHYTFDQEFDKIQEVCANV